MPGAKILGTLTALLVGFFAADAAHAADTAALLVKPELTRDEKAELVGTAATADLASIDRRTALQILAAHTDVSAKLALAEAKEDDERLTAQQRLPFLGALYNSRRDLDPDSCAMYVHRALGYEKDPPPPTRCDDLIKAGWTITRADFDAYVAYFWRAPTTPRPAPPFDLIADATATPPWTRTATATIPDILAAWALPHVDAIVPACTAALTDKTLPLRTRLIAHALLVRYDMSGISVKLVDGRPVIAQRPDFKEVDAGQWLLYNAYVDRDYRAAIAVLTQAVASAKDQDAQIAKLRKQGWDIQAPDLAALQDSLATFTMNQAGFVGQQAALMAQDAPDPTVPAPPAATANAPATGSASATRPADF